MTEHAGRVYVITGAASGIGAATAAILAASGARIVSVDLRDADVIADLGTLDGRQALSEGVTALVPSGIDAVIACAGVGSEDAVAVAVNYFGMVATLERLRPLLRPSLAPRAVGVASMAAIHPVDDRLVSTMLDGDEPGALSRAARLAEDPGTAGLIYGSTKRAFARWIRRSAPSQAWAAAGIALNAISPGIVLTPMVEGLMRDERWRASLATGAPMPLKGMMPPEVPAHLLAWLVSPQNSHMCGQIVYVDSGADAVLRGDATW
jgi:NAD(P)-dependent dehydrogenase (short-subunit alcohol dehydrogenase family)